MLFILISVIVLLINYIRIIIQLRYAHGILEKGMEVVDQYGKKILIYKIISLNDLLTSNFMLLVFVFSPLKSSHEAR